MRCGVHRGRFRCECIVDLGFLRERKGRKKFLSIPSYRARWGSPRLWHVHGGSTIPRQRQHSPPWLNIYISTTSTIKTIQCSHSRPLQNPFESCPKNANRDKLFKLRQACHFHFAPEFFLTPLLACVPTYTCMNPSARSSQLRSTWPKRNETRDILSSHRSPRSVIISLSSTLFQRVI